MPLTNSHELCPYEKLRSNIIQEREDDLMEMKKDLGLIKDEDDKEIDKVARKKGGKHKK